MIKETQIELPTHYSIKLAPHQQTEDHKIYEQPLIQQTKTNNFEVIDKGLETPSFKERFQRVKGLAFMILSMILLNIFMLMLKKLQKLNPGFTVVEVMLTRGFFQAVIQVTMIITLKLSVRSLNKRQMKLILLRSFSALFSMYMVWLGLYCLPLGLHSVLQNLNPIFTLILGYVVLKESLKRLEIVNLLCCFTGVLLVLVFKNMGQSGSQSIFEGNQLVITFGIAITICSQFLISLVSILLRQTKEIHFALINGIYGVILFVVAVIVWIFYRYVFGYYVEYNFDLTQWILIIMIGISSAVTNLTAIIAFQNEKAGRVAQLFFILILLGYFEDILFFNYEIGIFELLGVALIICCSSITLVLKYSKYSE